jgi:C-terminal processing protease CtpA/Prc
MQHVLHELGDFHGRIWHDGIPYNGIRRPYVPTSMQPDSLTLVNYWQTSIPVKGDVLDGSIGYVLVPGMIWGATDSLNAHILYNTLEEIERQHHPNGWVVDLRLNGGGTMFPMLCGLSPLLGEADLGSFTDPDTHYKEIWHLQDGEFYLDSTQVTSYGVGQNLDLSRKPVVVLLSSGTTSSGEVVALAFKGRPNTYFIGEATGGYTSTVSWLEMGNGIAFQLTESWYADRDDHIFQGEPIVPDLILSEGDQVLDPEADAWVRRGIEWLREH